VIEALFYKPEGRGGLGVQPGSLTNNINKYNNGVCRSVVIEALFYKPEGRRGFDTR
jgi:hypothetical protein